MNLRTLKLCSFLSLKVKEALNSVAKQIYKQILIWMESTSCVVIKDWPMKCQNKDCELVAELAQINHNNRWRFSRQDWLKAERVFQLCFVVLSFWISAGEFESEISFKWYEWVKPVLSESKNVEECCQVSPAENICKQVEDIWPYSSSNIYMSIWWR